MLHTQLRLDDWHGHRHYSIGIARSSSQVEAAQRLRYRVFTQEIGATMAVRVPGVDLDIYDPYCDHLIVLDEQLGTVVGTCRILTPEAEKKAGNRQADIDFDLTRLRHVRPSMVEVGRFCIHPDYRSSTVVSLLRTKIVEFMQGSGYRYLFSSAAIGMADGGHHAANLFVQELDAHLAPLEYRVFPRHPLPFERLVTGHKAKVPSLLKGWLRAGAWICGEPAWNPDFNTADLPLLLPMERLKPRYARQILKA